MAIDTKVLLEARASQSKSRVAEILLQAPLHEVIQGFDRRRERGDGFLDYARAVILALGSAARSSEREEEASALLLKVVLKVLDVVHSNVGLGDREAQECMSLIIQELEALSTRMLPSVTDSVLKSLQNAAVEDFTSLPLLPPCLALISRSADPVVLTTECGEQESMSGEDYVDKFIDCVIGLSWSSVFLTRIASLIRELPLDASQVERVLKKTFRCMKNLEPQDLPALVYQLLLLASRGFKRITLEGIVSFFSKAQKREGKKGDESSGSVLDQVVGTVVLHMNFAVKQDPSLGQELLHLLKSYHKQLSPFMISVLLSVARMQRFEQPSLDVLKAAIFSSYRNSQYCRDSNWAKLIYGDKFSQQQVALQQSLMRTVEMNTFGWEHIAPSVVKAGFLLMEATAPKSSTGGDMLTGSQKLGVEVLVAAFRTHDIARDEIIEQCKSRIIGLRPQQSYPVLRMVSELVQACPNLMLDYASRLKECLDYFTYLPSCSAVLLVQAICPIFQMSSELQDYAILVLRKAMFSRETAARITALEALLDILKSEKVGDLDPSLSGSEASCSQSSRGRSRKNKDLLLDLLGLLRRCLSQQAGVKVLLYRALPKVVLAGPEASVVLFDLLWPHFSGFYEAGEDNKATVMLDRCAMLKNDTLHINEPMDELLSCVHHLLISQPQRSEQQTDHACGFTLSQNPEAAQGSSGESLSIALQNLRRGLQATSLERMGLESFDGPEKIERASMFLGILEVLIDVATMELQSRNGDAEEDANKEIRSYVLLHESLSEKLSKKQGKRKPPTKPINDKEKEPQEDEATPNAKRASFQQTRKPHTSITCLCYLLRELLQLEGLTTAGAGQQKSLTDADVTLSSFTLKACLKHLKAVESDSGGSDQVTSNLDWTLLGKPLIEVVLKLKSTTTAAPVSADKRPKKNKKLCSEVDGLTLIALKCCSSLFRLAVKSSSPDTTIFNAVLPIEDCEEQQLSNLDRFLSGQLAPLLQHFLSQSKQAEAELTAGFYLLLASKLPVTSVGPHGTWALDLCKAENVNSSAVARLLVKLAIELSVPPADAAIAQSMANELVKVMGTEDSDAANSSEQYLIINKNTRGAIAGSLLHAVESMLSDIEWLVSSLKLQQRVDRVRQEESLHERLEALVLTLSVFTNMALPDSSAEQVVKIAIRIYKSLAFVTRLCIAGKGFKQLLPTSRFQTLAETTCKRLTRPMYTFMAISQRDQQENLKPKGVANKIKRESRLVPNLVYHIEDYEKNLIQLSKLTKVNLMRHAKRSTARDFKILEKAAGATADAQQQQAVPAAKKRIKLTVKRTIPDSDTEDADDDGEDGSPKRQRTD